MNKHHTASNKIIDDEIKGVEASLASKRVDNTGNKVTGLDSSGEFFDDVLESKYQDYVNRNTKSGKNVRDRLDWKEASDKWAKSRKRF
ncbi:hypothetical protein [Bacillus wiedmannii]|uniref:hypothetical protein n=1 Tax=Bacillus wiedmannii TaxID=1890302 RepID=UPI00019FE0D4|nr:hypothetical protein bcere0006_30480 [Bacillus wiedmannii]